MGKVGIKDTHQFPTLFAELIEMVVELVTVDLAPEEPPGGFEHDRSVFPLHKCAQSSRSVAAEQLQWVNAFGMGGGVGPRTSLWQ